MKVKNSKTITINSPENEPCTFNIKSLLEKQVSLDIEKKLIYNGVDLEITLTELFDKKVYNRSSTKDVLESEYRKKITELRDSRIENLLN